MFEFADPIVVNAFVVVFMLCIVAFTYGIVRLFLKATETLDEFNKTNEKVNKIAERVEEDYEYISRTVKGLSVTVEKLNYEVLDPIRSVGQVFSTLESLIRGSIGRFISSSEEDEDYLPEEKY